MAINRGKLERNIDARANKTRKLNDWQTSEFPTTLSNIEDLVKRLLQPGLQA